MIRRVNLLAYVRRYQWLLGGLILLAALFVMAKPEVPADLNYRYQLDASIRNYPLVKPTAGLVEWSTERVREVYRWNLTAETVGSNAPPDKAGTEAALVPATVFIVLGCLAMGMVWFAPRLRMAGFGLVLLVLAGSHVGAHPAAYVELMAVPSTLIPNAAATLVTKADPGHTQGVEREAATGLKDMADRYFEQYVTFTEHRMGSAGKLFANVKRVWFGVSGLAYVAPFAILLAGLAALTVLVQNLNWLFMMIAPFAIAVAMIDGRAGIKVRQHCLLPLGVTLVLLAALGLILPLTLLLATFVHAMESEIGLLLVGSVFPIMVTVGVALLIRQARQQQGGHHAPPLGALGSEGGTTWAGSTAHLAPVPARPRRRLRRIVPHRRRAGERHLGDLKK